MVLSFCFLVELLSCLVVGWLGVRLGDVQARGGPAELGMAVITTRLLPNLCINQNSCVVMVLPYAFK